MEIYERIKLLRKAHLKMTQEKFGEALGVNRSGINNIEGNRLVKPEQKEPLYRLICSTFNVRYEWLTTGQGDIFAETIDTFLDSLCSRFDISHYARKIIECYLKLDKRQQDVIDGFFESLVAACNSGADAEQAVDDAIRTFAPDTTYSKASLEREADEFAALARQQYISEKKQESQTSSAKESGAG